MTADRVCVGLRFRDTPVVKSSSRELCYIILAGICLGYLCTFSLIAKPHVIHCYLQRLGIGLSPAMSYSALVTKVRTFDLICSHQDLEMEEEEISGLDPSSAPVPPKWCLLLLVGIVMEILSL